MTTTIPIAVDNTEPPLGQTCAGCKHHWYSAPEGQPTKPYPQSRCLYFARDTPILLSKSKRWYASEIPAGCPTFAQAEMFG